MKNSSKKKIDESVGPLLIGSWQAMQALSQKIGENGSEDIYRLGFESSKAGIYILPFNINKKDFYICGIYDDVNNPALLKRNLRNLKNNLSNYLLEHCSQNEDIRQDFLFNNITDKEMDNLFSFSRY